MIRLVKLAILALTFGIALGAGAFEAKRYADHRDPEVYRFFAEDSTAPRYRVLEDKQVDPSKYSYAATQASYAGRNR